MGSLESSSYQVSSLNGAKLALIVLRVDRNTSFVILTFSLFLVSSLVATEGSFEFDTRFSEKVDLRFIPKVSATSLSDFVIVLPANV
ncbi:hypothetical protein BpHYR1_037750 [Brachionus plicatilis]|uniref:Uncharacterized protein n=1 Tax=Brachionus plicatilis TaxID=10195 RepID=A0A3M7QJC0_BRAPC|nr:hypothetical protein BpHYR1_037750 [Brachionus plicatilis]